MEPALDTQRIDLDGVESIGVEIFLRQLYLAAPKFTHLTQIAW